MTTQSVEHSGAALAEAAEGESIDTQVARFGPYLILLVAWTAMLGSLFFSEALGWEPCNLCWYQRILMYPIAIITTVALLVADRGFARYALTLAVPGILISIYHYVYQKTTWFDSVHVCGAGASCKGDYLGRGLVTIPGLAFVAFLLIIFTALAVHRRGGLLPLSSSRPWLPVTGTVLAAVLVMVLLMLSLPMVRLTWLGR